MRPLLTVAEVADCLRVAPSTVYRWARSGDLPSVTVAGTVRVPAYALEELVGVTPDNESETA